MAIAQEVALMVDSASGAEAAKAAAGTPEGDPFEADVQNALLHINWANAGTGACRHRVQCWTYINAVEVTFQRADNQNHFGIHVGVWRDGKSPRDCINNAKNALTANNRALAVMWVMASQLHNPPVKEWLRTHSDAVVTALGRV